MKVAKEEVKMAVKSKDYSKNKENKSELFNNLPKVKSPLKAKPLFNKQTSPDLDTSFTKEAPLQPLTSLIEELKDDSASSLIPPSNTNKDKPSTTTISMSGSQIFAFIKAEIAESVRDSLHELFTQIMHEVTTTNSDVNK